MIVQRMPTVIAMVSTKIVNSIAFFFQGSSWSCECFDGFTGNGTFCSDDDECVEGSNTCDVMVSTCLNTDGSYTCECATGYEETSKMTCDDIDECLTSWHRCSTNSTCENNDGSYACSCQEGTVSEIGRTTAYNVLEASH